MAKLLKSNEPFVYALQNVLDNDRWGYLFSHLIVPPDSDEHSNAGSFPQLEQERRALFAKLSHAKLPPLQGFDKSVPVSQCSPADLKKESWQKIKKANHDRWELRIAQLCLEMQERMQAHPERVRIAFQEVAQSALVDRNLLQSIGQTNITHESMKQIALGSWIFPTLPGTNPGENWPASLKELKERVLGLPMWALWGEPFDESYAFQEPAYRYLELTIAKCLQEPSTRGERERWVRLAFETTLAIVVNSGSYDRMVLMEYSLISCICSISCWTERAFWTLSRRIGCRAHSPAFRRS
jgi:hypothetical protein